MAANRESKAEILSPGLSIARYAFDDELVAEVLSTRIPQFRIYLPQGVSVVLGRGSDPAVELYLETCVSEEIHLFRRDGGGCSVVLSPGDVIVSAALPVKGIEGNSRYFRALTEWLVRGLKRCGGGEISRRGLSDLALGERKIGGSSVKRTKDYLLFSATIMVEPRVDLMERCLRHPPREPDYRRGRAHHDFVLGLKKAGLAESAECLAHDLRENLRGEELILIAERLAVNFIP